MEIEILSSVTSGGRTRFIYRAGNGPKRALDVSGAATRSEAARAISARLGAAEGAQRAKPETEPEEAPEPEPETVPESEPEQKTERVAATKNQKPRMQIKKKGR